MGDLSYGSTYILYRADLKINMCLSKVMERVRGPHNIEFFQRK